MTRPKLIPNAGRAWRLLSVQIAALAVAWGALPADTQAAVLGLLGIPVERVPAILGLLFLLGRVVAQPSATDEGK